MSDSTPVRLIGDAALAAAPAEPVGLFAYINGSRLDAISVASTLHAVRRETVIVLDPLARAVRDFEADLLDDIEFELHLMLLPGAAGCTSRAHVAEFRTACSAAGTTLVVVIRGEATRFQR